jgi:predicted Zn-dependent protease
LVGQIGSGIGAGIGIGETLLKKPSFTDADEERMAQANAQKFEAKNQIWKDPLLETYITDIQQRIVAVSKPRPFTYRARVVSDASVNAFTFGGGLLYYHAGLIARMENEAQLAMVMGHETGHVTERHVPRGIERAYGIQLIGQLAVTAGAVTGTRPPIPGAALDKAYEYSMNAAINGHGRGLETEADEIGLDYMVKAGYDPLEAPRTFEQLLKEYGDQSPVVNFFYSNHPSNVERIEKTTQLAKSKYANGSGGRRLVNTEEFKRRTREVVIAVGRLDYEGKRFNTATAMFQKAIRAYEGDPVPHYYLGKISQETGRGQAIDRALGHFNDAIKADAQYAPAYREMGLAYYRKNERQKAIQALERYLALDPKAKDAAEIRKAITELRRY